MAESKDRKTVAAELDTKELKLQGTCTQWGVNMKEVLFTEDVIQAKVKEMAALISRDYAGKKILAVGLLKGAFIFLADLLRHMTVPYVTDFMSVSSYSGTSSTGSIKLKKDVDIDPTGLHVLVVEDLIDTGNTLHWIKHHFEGKQVASVRIACLLNKKVQHRNNHVHVDYVGFDCPDVFVVGYGMDFDHEYRCLPYVGVLKPAAYAHLSPSSRAASP